MPQDESLRTEATAIAQVGGRQWKPAGYGCVAPVSQAQGPVVWVQPLHQLRTPCQLTHLLPSFFSSILTRLLPSLFYDHLQRLRAAGRRVDLVLEPKRLKWAFKQAERCNAGAWVG